MRGVFHSIRFLLPAALLVLIAGVLLAAAELGGRRFGRSDVESRASWIETAASLATTSIGLDLSRGQIEDAAAAVRKLESLGDISLAVLIDGRGRILASTSAGWTGQSLDRSPFAPDAAAIQSVWAGGASVMRVRHGDRFVIALPIRSAAAPGLPRSDAVLVLGVDLSTYPGRAHAQAYRFFAFVALGALLILALVAGFLHRSVAAPAFRLADTADRFAAGDRSARARSGARARPSTGSATGSRRSSATAGLRSGCSTRCCARSRWA
jgi:hypothetical protein